MDSLTAGVGGAIATIAAVVITHWLGQRGGKKRSDQVRDEIYLRLNAIDFRLNDVDNELEFRISEAAVYSIEAANQIRTDLQGSIVRREFPDQLQDKSVRVQTGRINGVDSGTTSTAH